MDKQIRCAFIAAGNVHCAGIDQNGNIYTWGIGK